MNDSRDFQDAESARSGQSHVTSQPAFFSPFPDPGGMRSRSLGMPSRNSGPPCIWDTHGISGNVFCKFSRVFFSTLSAGIESMEFSYVGTRIKRQFNIRDAGPDRQPEIHSSLVREDFQRIMGQTNNDCRFQIFISTNSPRQPRLLAGR